MTPTEEDRILKAIEFRLAPMQDDLREVKSSMTKLADAMTKLALVEREQTHTSFLLAQSNTRADELEERVRALEARSPDATRTTAWMDRGVIFVLGLAAMYVLKQLEVLAV